MVDIKKQIISAHGLKSAYIINWHICETPLAPIMGIAEIHWDQTEMKNDGTVIFVGTLKVKKPDA